MDPQTKKRILVVEDEAPLRELYVSILTDEGYAVDSAADGDEGYQKMYQGGYNLVMLDIMLPKLDGLKILEKLNTVSKPLKPNNAVVLLTNLGQDLVVAKAVQYNVRGYMMKSDYTPDQVVKEVKNYLV
jgi:DNA-binding response OmpR family regulator